MQKSLARSMESSTYADRDILELQMKRGEKVINYKPYSVLKHTPHFLQRADQRGIETGLSLSQQVFGLESGIKSN